MRMRMLSIPTVVDRLIQQALHQVLTPIFDPHFSESSYGFRPGRSAHQAVLKARSYVAAGKRFVVDMDLSEVFRSRESRRVDVESGAKGERQTGTKTHPQILAGRDDVWWADICPQGGYAAGRAAFTPAVEHPTG